MEREPEHTDDTPLRPVDDQVERDAADTVVVEDTDFTDQPLGAAASEVVEGRDGVVTLRGPVDGPEDADSAEAVVGAVRGVREVVDETTYG